MCTIISICFYKTEINIRKDLKTMGTENEITGSHIEETRLHQESVEQHNREMAITEKKELKYQKLAFLCSLLSAIFMGAVLAVVITVVLYAMPKVDAIYKSTMISLQNLETLTTSLNQADLAGTVNNINELTVQATDSLGNTMDRINSIDLEKLNTAIANLNATIEPMAAFFNVLGN